MAAALERTEPGFGEVVCSLFTGGNPATKFTPAKWPQPYRSPCVKLNFVAPRFTDDRPPGTMQPACDETCTRMLAYSFPHTYRANFSDGGPHCWVPRPRGLEILPHKLYNNFGTNRSRGRRGRLPRASRAQSPAGAPQATVVQQPSQDTAHGQ